MKNNFPRHALSWTERLAWETNAKNDKTSAAPSPHHPNPRRFQFMSWRSQ